MPCNVLLTRNCVGDNTATQCLAYWSGQYDRAQVNTVEGIALGVALLRRQHSALHIGEEKTVQGSALGVAQHTGGTEGRQ